MNGGGELAKPSIVRAAKLGGTLSNGKRKRNFSIKRANQRASWVVGLVFAVLPIIVCGLSAFIHYDDVELVNSYRMYIIDFFRDGEFLWLSITLLVMSLVSVFLYGIRKGLPPRRKFKYTIFMLVTGTLSVVSAYVYIDNIGNTISDTFMYVWSGLAFVLFGAASWVVSFKISGEA